MNWWEVVLSILGGLLLLWLALVLVLWWAAAKQPEGTKLGDSLRLVPDVVRLLRRLAADPSVPRAVRIRLVVLLIYLRSPINPIPDSIPVIGYADDAIIVAVVLRLRC